LQAIKSKRQNYNYSVKEVKMKACPWERNPCCLVKGQDGASLEVLQFALWEKKEKRPKQVHGFGRLRRRLPVVSLIAVYWRGGELV